MFHNAEATRFDVPEEEVTDTLIREMIHLFIYAEGIADDGPHGALVPPSYDENKPGAWAAYHRFGRCTDKMLESDSRRKHRFSA